mgnify:CR=1 FL=1
MRKLAGLLLLIVTGMQVMAQVPFSNENKIYHPQIRTVMCYNEQKEQSIPVILLKSAERLHFSFDDLEGGSKNYTYTIIHQTSNWQPSNLSPIEYLDGLSEDRIVDYDYSSNTLQKYTHYTLSLPNQQISPKISGNYLLVVYLDGDLSKPVISQRFYVSENSVNVGLEILPSMQVPLRNSNQKLNINIFHTSSIQNPAADIKVVAMQNFIPYSAKVSNKPSAIKPGELNYKDPFTNDFAAGNEFRKFDIRSLRVKGIQVQDIQADTINQVTLFTDLPATGKYVRTFDENGNFFIRNQDGRDQQTESDYVNLTFQLDARQDLANKAVYVVGRFNDYLLTPAYQLHKNAGDNKYRLTLKLKQGVYDYKYVLKDLQTGAIDDTTLEGTHFETDNSYQVFVYYKKPGSRAETLIGYSQKSR